ncbi:MAG: metal-dependent transcriptional regulator [Candidatus Kapabacteria bacterium]|nr:metal-dependent transcriptional regulator [Ignavibacteriota bacterium]MCW5883550.1 metal-dependent transcriptional regulator [Candidatus Kapabacteria bacterium]
MLNESIENYLKAIYGLSNNDYVSTNEIAEKLAASPSSVSKTLKKLSDSGYVYYTSHKGVKLTESGLAESMKILRRHRLLELFLHNVLGYDWDEIHDEACVLEHHISNKFEDAIDKYLGYPNRDPHGDPIPNKNGELSHYETKPVSELEVGNEGKIFRIKGNDPELLKYLSKNNLLPDKIVRIIRKEPFEGSVVLENDGKNTVIGMEVAKSILILEINNN